MATNGKQLFKVVRDFEVPSGTVRSLPSQPIRPVYKVLPATVAFSWPDGTPCIVVEMFLQSEQGNYTVRRHDGGSLKTLASALTPLVRYCWNNGREFVDLRDSDFQQLIEELQSERAQAHCSYRARSNNTIRTMIAAWTQFLRWIQETLCIGRVLVGLSKDKPQIPLRSFRVLDKRSRCYVHVVRYRYTPVSSTPEPKHPIGRELRYKLWEAVSRRSDPALSHERYRRRCGSELDFLTVLIFLKKRRELLLALLEATGARPAEIAELRVRNNADCSRTHKLELLTLKRRANVSRHIPVDVAVAMRLDVFVLKYRAALLLLLKSQGKHPKPNDRVFVTEEGNPVSPSTLEKEFSRLVVTAGINDQMACMSMFRHRFITNMIKLHLLEYMDKSPEKSHRVWTPDDTRTILHRVAVFTGHGNELSLLCYLDLAWAELDAFDYVEPARALMAAVENGLSSLEALSSDVTYQPGAVGQVERARICEQLLQIRDQARTALETQTQLKQKNH